MLFKTWEMYIPPANYIFIVINRNTRTKCEMCSKLTVKIPEKRQILKAPATFPNFESIFPQESTCAGVNVLIKLRASTL